MISTSQLSLELQNSLRLAHQAMKERGRKGTDLSPLENFYVGLSQVVLPGSQIKKLSRPGVEAFYSNNLDSEDFISLVYKDIFKVSQGFDSNDVIDACIDEYVSVGSRREEVERYISVQAVKQLWMTFAKLDTFGRLGLPNAEVNELLIRVAALSNIEGLMENLSSVASLELMDFTAFLDLLTSMVFKLLNKQLSTQMVQNLYDDIVHELLKKGSLRKKGHIVKNWKERFFVLTVSDLTYYETAEMSVVKGQITIGPSAAVSFVSDQGKATKKSSSRFRVTCGLTGTTTECVTTDLDSAREWIRSIQLAILYHKIEGRNFLHKLCQARSQGAEDAPTSPVEKQQFGLPSPPSSNNSSKSTLSGGEAQSSRPPPRHCYEDMDVVDKIIEKDSKQQQRKQQQQQNEEKEETKTFKKLSSGKSTSYITTGDGDEYATIVPARKTSAEDSSGRRPPPFPPLEQTAPSEQKSPDVVGRVGQPPPVAGKPQDPPPVPSHSRHLPSEQQDVTYIDIDFASSSGKTPQSQTAVPEPSSKRELLRREPSVEYASIDKLATVLASRPELTAPPTQAHPRSPSPGRRMGGGVKPKPEPRDGEYINYDTATSTSSSGPEAPPVPNRSSRQKESDYINFDNAKPNPPPPSPTTRPMREVSGRTVTKQLSRDGDYVGMGYKEGVPTIKSMQEVPTVVATPVPHPSRKVSSDGDYVGLGYSSGTGSPSSQPRPAAKPMQPVSGKSAKKPSSDGDYIGIVYEGDPAGSTVKPKPMVGASRPAAAPSPSRGGGGGDGYIGLVYDQDGRPSIQQDRSPASGEESKDGYINLQYEKPKSPPPVIPYRDAVKHQSSLSTPPTPAPRAGGGTRPKSTILVGDRPHMQGTPTSSERKPKTTDDYISLVPAGSTSKKTSSGGGLALAPSAKDSKHDYLLVLPETSSSSTPSSSSKQSKQAPDKPVPYGESHTYMNTKFESQSNPPPPLPPKSKDV